MGMKKKEKWQSLIRGIKTVFFLITLLISFLLISAPVFLVLADAILPSALLSAAYSLSNLPASDSSSTYNKNNKNNSVFPMIPAAAAAYFRNYDFRYSLIDIPLISIIRSIIIICVYSCCDGPRRSRGPYLWATTMCSFLSLIFVSFKASFVFGITPPPPNNNINILSSTASSAAGGSGTLVSGGISISSGTKVALFLSSYVLAVGHVVVAYRISCRERKKLLVYKIHDIEAVSACKNGFIMYQKMLQQERKK